VKSPAGKQVAGVTVFDPATDTALEVAFAGEDGRAKFTIPHVDNLRPGKTESGVIPRPLFF